MVAYKSCCVDRVDRARKSGRVGGAKDRSPEAPTRSFVTRSLSSTLAEFDISCNRAPHIRIVRVGLRSNLNCGIFAGKLRALPLSAFPPTLPACNSTRHILLIGAGFRYLTAREQETVTPKPIQVSSQTRRIELDFDRHALSSRSFAEGSLA